MTRIPSSEGVRRPVYTLREGRIGPDIGYMSGALKHFFDTVFHVCADDTRGLPYGLYVHGNLDLAGAVRSVESIAGGMGWRRAAPVVEVRGAPDAAARNACSELGSVLAAAIMNEPG